MNRSRVIDAAASSVHFIDHIAPVWRALPPRVRGRFHVTSTDARRRAQQHGIHVRTGPPPSNRNAPVLLASFGDERLARRRPFLMIEHGTGQSYGGEPPPGTTPDYDHACGLVAIACPNERTAYRNRLHHPHAAVAVTGTPKLDRYVGRQRPRTEPPCVAFVWHWSNRWIAPESDWAFPHWTDAVESLAARTVTDRGYTIVGHGHPRARATLAGFYRRSRIPHLATLDDVWNAADVVVFDNTSAGWESAAVGIPVVILDAPWYRPDVDHGLRFWEWADAGLRVGSGDADDLHDAIVATIADDPAAAVRSAAVDDLYPCNDGNSASRTARFFIESTQH